MAHAGFETFQGTQIFHFNFRGAAPADAIKAITDGQKQVAACTPGSVLTLTDVTDAVVDAEVTQAIRDLAKANRPYVKAAAVVGVTGLKKMIFNMVMMFSKRQMSLFDDPALAKAWLKARA
jgi:hypothetical protein